MANIIGARVANGVLGLITDDSQFFAAYRITGGQWLMQSNVAVGSASLNRISMSGNLMLIFDTGGGVHSAFAAGAGSWVCSAPIPVGANPTPPPTSTPTDSGGTITGIQVGPIPNSLTVTDANGSSYTLSHLQLTRAAEIITAAAAVTGVTETEIRICLITCIVESSLRILSNTISYPISSTYPNDGNAHDSDSVGLYQQRPSIGWGSVKDCMDPNYSTLAFLGGKYGPNHGSPRGLYDVPNWQSMTPGQAAQAVQGSAFPTRYDVQVPAANAIMAALIQSTATATSNPFRWPFQYSRYVIQTGPLAVLAQYGWRNDPFTGQYSFHAGLDFGAAGISGLPIPCAADGTVIASGYDSGRGNHVSVAHAGGFETHYFHMVSMPPVTVGQVVSKGQTLGNVGSTGWSTGAHLHWETLVNGATQNPRQFMKDRGVPES